MAIKFVKDFEFPSDFGFSKSAQSTPVKKAMGGAMPARPPQGAPGPASAEPTISMPASTAMRMGRGLVQAGALQGARAAASRMRPPVPSGAAGPAMPPGPPPGPAAPGGPPIPGLKKGGFVKKAIEHEGRETERAQKSGRSVHDQMEHDAHSSDPSLRGAGALGLRLTGGDLKPHKGKK